MILTLLVSNLIIPGLEQKIRALIADQRGCTVAYNPGYYDAQTVRRLSFGVIEQDALLETKDKQISQLALRLEVMKRTLHEKDESHHLAKRQWDEERSKLHACLTSSEKKSIFMLQNELVNSKIHLSNALNDIGALTAALESNNEALDATVKELEELREFKSRHSNDVEEISTAPISRTAVPELSISSRNSEVSMKNLDSNQKESNDFRELVVLSDGKTYNDLKAEVQLLRNEANAAKIESKFANQRIEQLSSQLEAKAEEVTKLQQDLATHVHRKNGKESSGVAAETSEIPSQENTIIESARPASPNSEYWSNNLKDFSIVADLEEKIIELEKKLDEYENPTLVEAEGEEEPALDPNIEQNKTTDTPKSSVSPAKKAPPESPLTARRLFQPLRRGWATASPLIKNPLTDSNESDLSKEKDVAQLNNIIKSNTEVMEKLKQDILKIHAEKEETEIEMMAKISKLTEENTGYAAQVEVLEKAFREMNDKRVSDGNNMTDDESIVATTTADPLSPSVHSDTSENTFGRELDLQTKNATLQRSITELESTQSYQEDEIERLKSELVKARVTSQQENEQLKEEVATVKAQRAALENQLIEINKSAGLLRDSLSDQVSNSPKKETETQNEPASPRRESDSNPGGNADPILVAQVVMLENANRVLEQNVISLRSDLQQKLTPLLEKVAMLEEEKRIMEDEMKVKLECREMTIKNLEHSLQQLNASRFGSGKKKRQNAQSSD